MTAASASANQAESTGRENCCHPLKGKRNTGAMKTMRNQGFRIARFMAWNADIYAASLILERPGTTDTAQA